MRPSKYRALLLDPWYYQYRHGDLMLHRRLGSVILHLLLNVRQPLHHEASRVSFAVPDSRMFCRYPFACI